MRTYRFVAIILFLIFSSSHAQDTKNFPTLGRIIRLDPAIDKLIPKDAAIEVLSSGFKWAEGPVWVPDESGDGCREHEDG